MDPALVHHYFGTKQDLLLAALELPVDPREVLLPVVQQGGDDMGERLLLAFLSVWDHPEHGPVLLAIARTVISPEGQRMAREGFFQALLQPVLAQAVPDRPEVRIPLVASQMVGPSSRATWSASR